MSALGKPRSLAVLLVALVGCGCSPEGTNTKPETGKVVVFAAAGTKDALHEIADAFTTAKGVKVVVNADDSSKLATQITRDAPAHLFLAANETWADFVKDKGYAEEV